MVAKQTSWWSTKVAAYVIVFLLTSLISEGAFLPSGSPVSSGSAKPTTQAAKQRTARSALHHLEAVKRDNSDGTNVLHARSSTTVDIVGELFQALSKGSGGKRAEALLVAVLKLLSNNGRVNPLLLPATNVDWRMAQSRDTLPRPKAADWRIAQSRDVSLPRPKDDDWRVAQSRDIPLPRPKDADWRNVRSRDISPRSGQLLTAVSKRLPLQQEQQISGSFKRLPFQQEQQMSASFKRLKPKFNPTGWRRKRSATRMNRNELQSVLRVVFARAFPETAELRSFPGMADKVDDVDPNFAEWHKRETLRKALERLPIVLKPKRRPLEFNPTGW